MTELLYSFLSWTENPHRAGSVSSGGEEEVVHSTPIKARQTQVDQSETSSALPTKTNVAILDSQKTVAGTDKTSKMVSQLSILYILQSTTVYLFVLAIVLDNISSSDYETRLYTNFIPRNLVDC